MIFITINLINYNLIHLSLSSIFSVYLALDPNELPVLAWTKVLSPNGSFTDTGLGISA
jgi:hypothetical protein